MKKVLTACIVIAVAVGWLVSRQFELETVSNRIISELVLPTQDRPGVNRFLSANGEESIMMEIQDGTVFIVSLLHTPLSDDSSGMELAYGVFTDAWTLFVFDHGMDGHVDALIVDDNIVFSQEPGYETLGAENGKNAQQALDEVMAVIIDIIDNKVVLKVPRFKAIDL